MDTTRLDDFVANAALLAAHLTQQCEAAAARQEASARDLGQAAAGAAERLAESEATLRQTIDGAVRTSMAGEVDAASRAVGESARQLQAAVLGFEHAQARLDSRIRRLGGGALVALALGALAMLGSSGYLARQSLQRAERANVRAEVLEALEQVAITSCDGAPCIKLEPGLRRWSRNDEYVLVDRAPPAP
ncbi:hypothetical protein [Luteimonas deserti]|uniref:Relaxation protein n=1 Tax=Luteimonas deserti TaxID=2752306 RepID=A0A7Z0QPH0_9GAMM|nr:hypothetical protein [Luteimonas deserti]NYZ62411.1 hypothetical protein [Luteimonas deserti]